MSALPRSLTPIALAGQTPMHAPHALQASSSSSGTKGPPMRGVNQIACSGQMSRHDWQAMPDFAKQDEDMATAWANLRGVSPLNTGSGQAFAHSPQKVHSPIVKSRAG